MERYRLKTIVIIILLIINGFLLVLVASRRNEAVRYEQSALERTVRVLEKHGIRMENEAVTTRDGLAPGIVGRSIERERALALVLLGENVLASDLGGGVYSYTADSGTVSFRTGGGFSFVPSDKLAWHTEDPMVHSAGLLDAAGVEYRWDEAQISAGTGEVVYVQSLDGAPLFPCTIAFSYQDGVLTGISGTLLLWEKVETEEAESLGLSTVLMGFLEEILSSGDVCSAVLLAEPGYLLSQSFSGTTRLEPAWYIDTNTADYYVNGITGGLTRIIEK